MKRIKIKATHLVQDNAHLTDIEEFIELFFHVHMLHQDIRFCFSYYLNTYI